MQQLQYIAIGDPQSPSFTFEGDDIMSTTGDFSVDLIGAELCTDVMEIEVAYDDADGTLRALPWATPVYTYRGASLEGKFYSVSVTRTGKKAYLIRVTSAAGILEYETFYGGMYTGETFRTVVEQIIGTNALQPFAGVYRHLIKEYDALDSMLSSNGMGKYQDQAKTQEYKWGCYLSATMSSKLSAKIKINGFSNAAYDRYIAISLQSPGTTYISKLLGVCAGLDAADTVRNHQYGLYMSMARASTSDPFPAFGDVFFAYGQDVIYLGRPESAEEAVYEIAVDPGVGHAVINGVTYPIGLNPSLANDACALHVYGGGAELFETSGSISARNSYPNCDFETFYYQIRSQSGELQADQTAVKNVYTGQVGLYDCGTGKLRRQLPCASVLSDDLEPYDVSTYGGSLLFNNRSDFQTDVLSRMAFSEGVDTIPIYGWIPICTKRQALQQLLFATGAILVKDEDGSILFTMPSPQTVDDIDEDSVYDEGRDDQPDHINSVEITEHAYTLNSTAEAEVIYENATGAADEYYIAPFSVAPAQSAMSEYPYSGYLTVIHANCNAALVSGTGKFMGRPYLHTEKILRREIASFPDGHAASIPDATLVTLINSEGVLDRLEAYYGGAHKTRVDIAMEGQRCGLKYTLTSAFGEAISGFLVRANKVITSVVRAACEFVLGYTPPKAGNTYASYVILTGSGSWTVPASVFQADQPRIHVVLIGGGRGGDGGYAGESGDQPEPGQGAQPAEGGAAGESGSGGKIFEITIQNPAASYAYSCGQGGSGGAISGSHSANNLGSDGGDTTFSGGGQSYSSSNGSASENGIANSITGERYAGRLISSWKPSRSNRGGDGGYFTAESWGSSYHLAGDAYGYVMDNFYETWFRGYAGADDNREGWILARGGGGGGGGYGQIGSNGSAASYSDGVYRSGNGGKGGDATETPPKATDYNPAYYGYGGLGGGGGGGGGAGGWVTEGDSSIAGTGGAGGYGGRGGDGGDGCVLIYY